MKNIFIKISLLLIIILLSCNLFFYLFRVPDLKKKISKAETSYAEIYKENEDCQFGYTTTLEQKSELENQIATYKATIEEKEKTIQEKNKTITNKDAQIKKLNQKITNLKK